MADNADEKEEDVFHADEDEKNTAPEAVVEPKAQEPLVVVDEPKAEPQEPPLTFPEGTTAKDLAMELFILYKIQIGINHSPMPMHLRGATKTYALERYNKICAILEKMPVK